MNKKEFGIGICLMLLGLTMFFGSNLLPDTTMDWRAIQVGCMLIGLLGVFMCGLSLIILSFIEDKKPVIR